MTSGRQAADGLGARNQLKAIRASALIVALKSGRMVLGRAIFVSGRLDRTRCP
jgi:hypothetical protein